MDLITILNIFGMCLAVFNCDDDNQRRNIMKRFKTSFLNEEKAAGLTKKNHRCWRTREMI